MAPCAVRLRSGSFAPAAGSLVRSYRGHDARWFQTAQQSHEGEIDAGGVRKRVRFIKTDDAQTQEAIDEAYRSKYGRYGTRYVDPMVAAERGLISCQRTV